MHTSTVKHKLRVFISSKCGGKYNIARNALKELLLSTGLVDDPYVYECEPAASDDTISSYLDNVDDSNLCIFLIDNEDGVPGPVLSEEKRAKEKGLRLIYIFCDETKKEPTVMQTEIKKAMSQKYQVVSCFSDIVKAAYDSAMQDIVTIYKKKPYNSNSNEQKELQIQENSNDLDALVDREKHVDTIQMEAMYTIGNCSRFVKLHLGEIAKTEHCLLEIVSLGQFFDKEESNEFDEELSCFLKAILYKSPFDEDIYIKLTDKMLENQPIALRNLLSLRFSAIKHYFGGRFDCALQDLQLALKESIENASIPNWISLDIAIDIRSIIYSKDELGNQFTSENMGQKFIDDNPEALCFPELDRFVREYKDNLMKHYIKIHYSSPYSINVGGMESLFTPVAKAFCVASAYGSLAHILMTKKYISEILFTLTSLYNDHDFVVELLRELIIDRNKSQLDIFERVYETRLNMMNATDVKRILESLNNIAPDPYQMMSRYLALTYLGYYLDDTCYAQQTMALLGYAKKWIASETRVISLGTYIFNYLEKNYYRTDNNQIIEIILCIYESKLIRWYRDCMKLIRVLDYNNVLPENQMKIANMLITCIKENENLKIPNIEYAITSFAKKANFDHGSLEDILKEYMPDYYKNVFCLETISDETGNFNEFVETYLEFVQCDNEIQGANGLYINSRSKPLETVRNIAVLAKTPFSEEIVEKAVEVSLNAIKSSNQTFSAKSSATELLIVLHHLHSKNSCWGVLRETLVEKEEIFTEIKDNGVFDKYTDDHFRFSYQLLLLALGQDAGDTSLDYLLTLDPNDTYSIIDALRLLCNLFSNSEENAFSHNFLSGCANYAIMMLSSTERDVAFYSVKCLIEMTKYKNLQKAILRSLSRVMDNGTQTTKMSIASRINKIQCNDRKYLDYILMKASVDNSFLVRMAGQRSL